MTLNEKQIKTLNEIKHEIASCGQSFHSYSILVVNPSLHINPKKMHEILDKCAKRCLEMQNLILKFVEEEPNG